MNSARLGCRSIPGRAFFTSASHVKPDVTITSLNLDMGVACRPYGSVVIGPLGEDMRKILAIAAISLIGGLAGCGSTPATSPSASISTTAPGSPSAKPTPTKLSASQLAAKKAAEAKTAAKKKAAAARKAAAAKKAAAKKAAVRAAKIRAENTPISAAQWGRVIRNPDAYAGDIYTISGTVAEYNLNSNTIATTESAALVAVDASGNDFIVEADASKLGNVQPGQTFTAKVTVLGAVQVVNTVSGGTGEAPDFDASRFTVTG